MCHHCTVFSFQSFPGTDLLQLINFNIVTAKQILKAAVNWIYQVLLLIEQTWLHVFKATGITYGYFLFLFLIRSINWKITDKTMRKNGIYPLSFLMCIIGRKNKSSVKPNLLNQCFGMGSFRFWEYSASQHQALAQ